MKQLGKNAGKKTGKVKKESVRDLADRFSKHLSAKYRLFVPNI